MSEVFRWSCTVFFPRQALQSQLSIFALLMTLRNVQWIFFSYFFYLNSLSACPNRGEK